MASRRSGFDTKGGRYIYQDHSLITNGYDSFTSTTLFEFNDSDIWDIQTQILPTEQSKIRSKPTSINNHKTHKQDAMLKLSSLPLNIPDWSRIPTRENEGDDDDDDRVPPHEYLGRRRGASLSVQEGIGRTLKGRDLSRVRNAVWKRTGFED